MHTRRFTYQLLLTVTFLLAAHLLPQKLVTAAPGAMAFDADEVLLTFRYRGVGNVYITGLYDYDLDQMFLPVAELFSLFEIYLEPSPGDFTLSGNFITPDKPYRFEFNQQRVILEGKIHKYEADDFRIGDIDYYVSPRVFEEVFGLFFTVNMNQLTLSLETTHTLPVEDRAERERRRQLIEAREVTRAFFPLELDRDRKVVGIGFADYNITTALSQGNQNMNYNIVGGIELLGGDMQGNVIGSWSEGGHNIRTSGLRWRYVVRDNPWFSTFSAGQLSTSGLQPRSFRGASISNDPVEPRRMYETYIIDGYTDPDSEVELYLNNRLIDFRRADQSGYYRFEFPITYGTSRLTINIYTPTGEARTIDRQLQIPFTFLPPGEVAYNIQGGLTETFIGGDEEENAIVHGDVAMGLTSWLTAKVGSEYIRDANDNRPFVYGSLSARVLSQYLVNVDLVPNAYYRGITSVMFPSGRSFNVQATWYDGESLFNTRGAEHDLSATVFIPFVLFERRMGFRIGGENTSFGNSSLTRYRTDLSLRIGRFNVRMNYRDALFYSGDEYSLGQGIASGNVTYTFMRSPGIPVFARGMFLRLNMGYSIANNAFDQADLQLTRTIRQWGRLNVNAGYDFRSSQATVRMGFTVDLAPVRSTTNLDMRGQRTTMRQNFRGSVGFDHNPDRIVPTNRNQVGRAGASVILFIDNNNSGTFDEGDEIIPARAVRLDRSARMQVGSDGVLRISQLQSYFRYNLEVVRQALPNPLLAPGKDRFSFVADPNRYKRIEIPFYRTGVIDGTTYILRNGQKQTQGGLRIIIQGIDNDFSETIRNFSDGSYYAMDMPPGRYTASVDPTQLSFLNAQIQGGPVEFEIRALSEGDFIEGLDIVLEPKPEVDEVPEPIAEVPEPVTETPAPVTEEAVAQTISLYNIQLGLYATPRMAEDARSKAVESTGAGFQTQTHEMFNLYIVQSQSFRSRQEAQQLLTLLLNLGFDRAFLRSFTQQVPIEPAAPAIDELPAEEIVAVAEEDTEEEISIEPAEDIVADIVEDLPEEIVDEETPGLPEEEITEPLPPVSLPFEEAALGEHYYIVVNRFNTIYRAESVRREASNAVDLSFFIRHDRAANEYIVYSSSIEDAMEAAYALNQLAERGFVMAAVEHTQPPGPEPLQFQVHIAAFPNEGQASEALNSAQQIMDIPLVVEVDPITQRHVLRTKPYESIPEAGEALEYIQGYRGYGSSFVVSKPRIFALPVINMRGM